MNTYRGLILLSVYLFSFTAQAQQKADSLSGVIKAAKNDTIKVKALNLLFRELYFSGKTDSSLHIAAYTKDVIEKLLNKGSSLDNNTRECLRLQQINAYSNIGKVFLGIGNFPDALKYDTVSLRLAKELNDKTSMAVAYGNLGSLYTCTGSYPEALKDEFEALRLEEETDNKHLMASAYTNIGNIYTAENNYTDALRNHGECLRVSREIGFKQGMVWAYNNIGGIYEQQGKKEEALNAYDSCLEISKAIGYKEGVGASYANMGVIYAERGNYNEALKSQFAAKQIYEDMGYAQYVANSYEYIGETYLKQKKYDDAESNLQKGLDIALNGGYKEISKGTYRALSNVYEELAQAGSSPAENWEKAHENYKKYVLFYDSLFNEATRKKSEQAQMQFQFDKKEATAKAEQDKKDAILAAERQKQALIRNCLLAGFILVLILAFLIYRGYRLKQRANVIISKQKDVVEQKNLIIETKNKAITDSLNYAQRIQNAILAPEEELNKVLQEYFILYQPKDIVSGDFYFFRAPNTVQGASNTVFIAACDCTGHGVPGAFMSLIGSEKLNDALDSSTDTGNVLKIVNKNIRTSLHQSSVADSTKDGMDVALASLSPSHGGLQTVVQFSGANRPLWIVRKGESIVEEVRPTKQSIGGFTDDGAEFESHSRRLSAGDAIYMFTDGYADQFGGEEGKKLTTKKFREILVGISHKSMQEQKERLKKFLDEWKGANEQVDDILLIGIRI